MVENNESNRGSLTEKERERGKDWCVSCESIRFSSSSSFPFSRTVISHCLHREAERVRANERQTE